MGTPITGNGGKVAIGAADVADVLDWTLNDMVETHSWRSNNTSGARKRLSGGTDWDGSFNCLLDTAAAALAVPGAIAAIHLHVAGSDEYTGSAIIKSKSVNVNIDSGAPVSHNIVFEANGAITRPTFP